MVVDVKVEHVLPALQRRIGDDALALAVQQVRIDQLEVEVTQLRARVAELEGAPPHQTAAGGA